MQDRFYLENILVFFLPITKLFSQKSRFQSKNLYQIKKTRNKMVPPAPMAIQDVAFNKDASFLYLLEWCFRFCAFVSSSVNTKSRFLNIKNFHGIFFLPERTAPRCKTSSIFWTIIRCTSCNSVLSVFKLRRLRLS